MNTWMLFLGGYLLAVGLALGFMRGSSLGSKRIAPRDEE